MLNFLNLLPLAQAAAGEETTEKALGFTELLEKGGVVMYPLILLSVAAVVLIVFYLLTISRRNVVNDRFMNAAEALIRKRDYLGLIAACNKENSAIAQITEKSLDFVTKNSSTEFSQVREVAEAEGSRQAGMLNQRISYLADIGSIAPMVGLLGTVIGMIQSFFQISTGGVEGVRQMQLAGGVYEALITTATGLTIGIVSMIFYSFFRGRVQKYISELEAAATHIMALLGAQLKKSAARQAGGQPVAQQVPSFYDEPDYGSATEEELDHRPAPTGPTPIQEDRPDLGGI